MSDAGFVLAAYGVVLGGLGLYTVAIWRRLTKARREREQAVEARDEGG